MDYRAAFNHTHPFVRLLMLTALMLLGFVLVSGLSLLIAMLFLGDGILSQLGQIEYADGTFNLNLLRYTQVLSHIGLFVIPSLVFAFIMSNSISGYLRASLKPHSMQLVLALIIMAAGLPIVGVSLEWNQQMQLPAFLSGLEGWMRQSEASAERMTFALLSRTTWQALLFNLFMMAILPAIGEEFVFRGIVQRLFGEWTRSGHAAVIITALLFSAMHMQFFSFLPRFVLGLLLGYMFLYSGNIWVPVLAHFANNAAVLIVYHLLGQGLTAEEMQAFSMGSFPVAFAVGASLVIVVLLYRFRKYGPVPHRP